MTQKYSWFGNHEGKLSFTVIHKEGDVETIIAISDTSEKAHSITKALNERILDTEDFTESAKPLINYLAKNHHPHVTAIVTNTNAELLEGIKTTGEITFKD